MTENEIATIVVDAAFKVHSRFGPGLLESVLAPWRLCVKIPLSGKLERSKVGNTQSPKLLLVLLPLEMLLSSDAICS